MGLRALWHCACSLPTRELQYTHTIEKLQISPPRVTLLAALTSVVYFQYSWKRAELSIPRSSLAAQTTACSTTTPAITHPPLLPTVHHSLPTVYIYHPIARINIVSTRHLIAVDSHPRNFLLSMNFSIPLPPAFFLFP